jgi:DNA-binding CsgD family transcriptional regulator
MAQGLLESVAGDGRRALSTLMRATAMQELDGPAPLLVETPAVVAALMALHLGDLDVAESALARGVDGGAGASGVRHRLLVGWTAMLRGRYSRARELLSAARSDAGRLALRDELLARALAVGLARRTSDVAALVTAWRSGWDVLLRHPVDLFTLLPLGEFAVASARLREFERVEPHLDDARSLLSALGEPATWSPALDWSLLQAAILRNRPDEVEPHARALVAAAPRSDFAAALAAAGRAWMQVLTTRFATPEVEQAAQRLQRFGLAWDGSRLLGQAAAHTSDRRRIAYLLHAARALQEPDDPRPTEGPAGAERAAPAVLSTREMEIAELLVQQRTYREIGDELFISPKTVEHHVARIKQRLGVSDRADLLARLRAPSATG